MMSKSTSLRISTISSSFNFKATRSFLRMSLFVNMGVKVSNVELVFNIEILYDFLFLSIGMMKRIRNGEFKLRAQTNSDWRNTLGAVSEPGNSATLLAVGIFYKVVLVAVE